jgi:hypothetical protein
MIGNRSGLCLAVLAAGTVFLGGCKTSYVADVRNESPEPVYAQLVRNAGAGNNTILTQERIPPGDRRGVARYQVPEDWAVFLSVDTVGNAGYPQQFNLTPGTTIVTVTKDQNGRLRLDAVPRP